MKKKAIVITDGILDTSYAKTAHGLIRESDRFEVLAIIDKKYAGADAGEILDGNNRMIPVISSISEAMVQFKTIDYLIVGVATKGGILSDSLLSSIRQAITYKLNIINGLHNLLCEHEDIVKLAKDYNVELIDIRKPKPIKELHFWTGEVFKVDIPIIAVLGMDCSMGKRTTTRLLLESCKTMGIHAEMIYTGQTGWMQGSKYGFIFDATINDFVSGELENTILNCWRNEKPDLMFLEGQSSLRNPSGPCGLELLISGNAKQVVLVHEPGREYFDYEPTWGEMPSVKSEIEIIEKFGSKVIGLALNTTGITFKEAKIVQDELEKTLNIPVVMPLEEGVHKLISTIKLMKYEN